MTRPEVRSGQLDYWLHQEIAIVRNTGGGFPLFHNRRAAETTQPMR